jgi:hypothetical protein
VPASAGARNSRTLRMLSVATAAEVVYQVASANLSSPQSNELDAGARAPTLQKWVNISNAEAAGWVIMLCVIDGSMWPALGGGLALGGLVLKYRHAISSGLAKGGTHSRGGADTGAVGG